MSFKLRLIDHARHSEICRMLDLTASGDRDARDRLVQECKNALAAPEFATRNPRPWMGRHFAEALSRAISGEGGQAAAELAGPAIALLCMPDYTQMLLPVGHPDPSVDSLCELGEADGGLYGSIASEDPWFADLLAESFHTRAAPYGLGGGMFLLTREEVGRLSKVGDEAATFIPDAARGAAARLARVCRRALAQPKLAIAVSDD